jgi:cold shock CspA family protein
MKTLNREQGRNPNLGFGMVPPKPKTLSRYLRSAQSVLGFLFDAEPTTETLDAISEVKGLCNRVLREDQPDWVVVWLRLGLPSKRRMKWMAGDLPKLRQAVKEGDVDGYEGISEKLLRAGLGTALKFFVDDDEPPPEDGRGYLYLLSTRSDRNLLKIGQTQRRVLKRVEEINRATGVVEPFSPRNIWFVKDPVSFEREVHKLLSEYRVRIDREFFRLDLSEASRKINELLRSMGVEARVSGRVKSALSDKGFGFIEADGSDYFFHVSELRGLEFQDLQTGDEVTFCRLDTRLGLAAAEVRLAR